MSTHRTRFLDPKNDCAFERIFGREKNKDILIGFLNDTLNRHRVSQITEAEFLPAADSPDIVAERKGILDILCLDQDDAQYIVEMQLARADYTLKRVQYHAARAYVQYRDKEALYKRFRGVFSVIIADFVIFPKKKAFKSDHVLSEEVTGRQYLDAFQYTFIELPKFEKSIDELESDSERWYYYLKHAPETDGEVYKKLTARSPIIQRAFHELDKANWSEEEIDAYNEVLKKSYKATAKSK